MDLGLSGRRAAVAAASSGLGYATAERLVSEGALVTICGSDEARIAAAAERLGHDTIGLTVDLSRPEEGARFVHSAAEALGGLDILVINGPGPQAGSYASTPVEAYAKAVELSLLTVVQMAYAAVPIMQRRRWGRIVAITSNAVRQPKPNLILSNTARAGATGFLKTLAREIAADGITVNSVQPGMHATDRITSVYGDGLSTELADVPAGEVGRPEDFGAVVAFLCSESARYITGVALPVDGGQDRALQ
jgi:3-oxoacyl-[acyl-carrier protein] reductase